LGETRAELPFTGDQVGLFRAQALSGPRGRQDHIAGGLLIFRPMCGRARLSSDVSEIKLVFSIPAARPTPNFAPRGQLRAPDDLCRSSDAKDLDETGHLVEQVSVSTVLALFSQDDHGDKAGGDLLNPTGVFQNAICRGHQTTHPSK